MSQETKDKIRKANTGYKHTEEAKRKMSISRRGRVISKETGRKISKALKGRKISDSHRINLSGTRSSNWKGGISRGYWKKKVFEKDNYTCQKCGLYDPDVMEADHIKPKSDYPELMFNINNGETLCANCHRRKTNIEHRDRILNRV